MTTTTAPDGQDVAWSSSDASVATVENGVVTGVAEGTAIITATYGGKTATCEVTISKIAVTNISISRQTIAYLGDEAFTLTASVRPSDATI